MAFGTGGSFLLEGAQAVCPALGEAQLGDIGMDTAGAFTWLLFEGAARELHNSGLTVPVYILLGISKRS